MVPDDEGDGVVTPTSATVPEGARTRRGLEFGRHVGRYLIQKELARGGMGIVYQARDPELGRGVALKLVQLRSDTAARASLMLEAQALAQLSHPNVIAVYDVGTHQGDLFIAMELIEGPSLRAWMRAATRPWQETMRILLAAGRGLAAAHARGLVHRDFKPDNVMIGDDERVRVLDFGLARPMRRALDEVSDSNVGSGDRDDASVESEASKVVGTPRYMSPEQHRGGGLDAVSDQFSYCVTAWEALGGTRPFGGRTLEDLRLAKEAGRPESGPTMAKVPTRIRNLLRRGMSPKPDDRFASMDALLAALTHAMSAPRRRAMIAGGAATVVGVLALIAWPSSTEPPCRNVDEGLRTAWNQGDAKAITGAFGATKRPHAVETAKRANETLERYLGRWSAMRVDSCEATHVRRDQSPALLDLRTRCLDRHLETVRTLVAVFRSTSDPKVVDHAVEAVLALPDLAECANVDALRDELALPGDPTARARVIALDATLARARTLIDTAQYAEARIAVDQLLPQVRGAGHAPQLAATLLALGDLQDKAGDGDGATTTLREASRVAAAAHDDRRAALALIDLVWITGHWQAHYDEALAMLAATEAAVARAGNPPDLRSTFDSRLGTLLGEQGHRDEAIAALTRALALRERTLGDGDARLAPLLNNLGEVQREGGQFEAAEANYRRALELTKRALGPQHPNVAAILNNLGSVLWEEGKLDDAYPLLVESLALDEATFGADHPRVATSLITLGGFLNARGRTVEARAKLERALVIQRRALGPDHPELAMALHNLGVILDGSGDHAGALRYFEEAIRIFERASPDHPRVTYPLAGSGEALVALGRLDEARAAFQRAIDLEERAFGAKDTDDVFAFTGLGHALLLLGRAPAAVAPLERAVGLREHPPIDDEQLARARFFLAQALWVTPGARRRAVAIARQAHDGYASAHADPEVQQLEHWLATHRAE